MIQSKERKFSATFRIFIFTSLAVSFYSKFINVNVNHSFILPVEAGSKSSKGSSKTTVIAIDGGGGGGKAHPVPVPWPVIHCHHHHHHMKYVPKPVLVHHWVKKSKYSPEELAATSMNQHLLPMMATEHQANSMNLEQLPISLAVGSEVPTLNADPSSPFDGLMSDTQMVSSLNNIFSSNSTRNPSSASNLPDSTNDRNYYKLSQANRNAGSNSSRDVDSVDSLINFALLSNGTLNNRINEYEQSIQNETTLGSSFNRGKPNHPFKGPFDQLKDESNQQQSQMRLENLFAKVNRANENEERQARIAFEKLNAEHAGRLVALEAMNRIVGADRFAASAGKDLLVRPSLATGNGKQGTHQRKLLNPRAGGLTESRTIELMTKLVEQVAQSEAKKLIARVAQRNSNGGKNTSSTSKSRQSQEGADESKKQGRIRSFLMSSLRGDAREGKRRRNSASLLDPYDLFSSRNGWSQFWHQQQQHSQSLNLPDLIEGSESVQFNSIAESPAHLRIKSVSPGITATTTSTMPPPPPLTTSTLTPEMEGKFYQNQHDHLLRQQQQQAWNNQPVDPSLLYATQPSDIHNMIAEPPQAMASTSTSSNLTSLEPEPATFNENKQHYWPQTPQQQLQYENQFAADQLMPYLEFPLSAQEWSAEAFKSINPDLNAEGNKKKGSGKQANAFNEMDNSISSAPSEANLENEVTYELDGSTLSPTKLNALGAEASQIQGSKQPFMSWSQSQRIPTGSFGSPLDQSLSNVNMMALSDPLYVDASADMNRLRQFQGVMNTAQPLMMMNGSLTDVTQLSRGLRDQMRTLGGRGLPQVPNVPQPPQIPNLPMPPPGMMMQMAGLALPFAMARATRQNRIRQTQQVNAAASAGGSTATGPRQRLFNRALSLTNRFARPRPRRPANPASSSSSTSSSSISSLRPATQTGLRSRNNLVTVLRTVADMSRRAPLSALPAGSSSSSIPKIKPKVDHESVLLGARSRRLSRGVDYFKGAQKSSLNSNPIRRYPISSQVEPAMQESSGNAHHHLVLPGSLMTTLNDGSLAQFDSMNSPVDLLARELRLRAQNRWSNYLSNNGSSNKSTYGYQHFQGLPLHDGSTRTAPVVANHINLLLINAQNVTQGHSPSGLQEGQLSVPVTQEMALPEPSPTDFTGNQQPQQPDQDQFTPTDQQTSSNESSLDNKKQPVEQQTTQMDSQPASSTFDQPTSSKSNQKPETFQPAKITVTTTTTSTTKLPKIFRAERQLSPVLPKSLTTNVTKEAKKSPVILVATRPPNDYVRAIKLVREVAYPWPPPNKFSEYKYLKA